jgi:hypothetical protein
MPTVHLSQNCGVADLARSLDDSGSLAGDWSSGVIHVDEGAFVDVGAIALLCCWAQGKSSEGRRLHFRGDDHTIGYLARMDLHDHAGLEFESTGRQDETGRFLPLKLVESDADVYATTNAICDLVLHQFDNANAFLPALEWAINEIIDNIFIHSRTPVPGTVCAQYFPKRHRLDVGICDLGIGIKESLGHSRKLWSHGDAVTTALQRGVTRDPSVGQGNGMAGAREISLRNGGLFQVWTGDALYRLENGEEKGFVRIPELPGTGVLFSLDTRRPVDLLDTWIAGSGWSFINVEARRIEEEGGIDIAASCVNTGGRLPARRLRRKLAALLPEMDEPLVLDFSNVRSAASSFLDELLGRLAAEFGEAIFEQRIRIVGMDAMIRETANVVIAQRLGLEERPRSSTASDPRLKGGE